MRLNTPIVDSEFEYPESQTLVSITDLKGRIVYCNPAFVEVSGYAHDELMGQPHNLIRHPDVPEEAFRDLWDTVQAGKPWSAPVKNRRKDGRYYWVLANVTPIIEGNAPVGYMSVRVHPTREQVKAAEALYAQLRPGPGQGAICLRGGRVVRTGWRGRTAALARPSLGLRLGALAFGLAAAAFGAGAWAGSDGSLGALAGGAALSALAAGVVMWCQQQLAVRPLAMVLSACNRMAAGDLRQRLDASRAGTLGEVATAFNQLNVNLLSVVGDARQEVERMRRATNEIAAGNRDLSSRTESQAASLEQTAASMEQITATVRQSADSARQAAGLAADADAVTQAGSGAVQTLSGTMQQISASSHRIGEIIGVIEGIAMQTNLLSLNAAVEAARAGEQGRGFAVVAGEVRALAQRTTGAAKEVRALIETSGRNVDDGARQADEACATIRRALDSVQQVSSLIQVISAGAQEQLDGISQVNVAVSQLDSITQQNAALVQQVADSAVNLQGRAETVSAAVRVFQLGRADDASVLAADAVALRREAKGR
ncbi:methyl-accepting chemotaxis protein [Ideonella sp.]|uniref:methyl-accepting chemotaxis protein n=1 Tax=Ideonella sp. TaxID=1929293 RepID=UPI002B498494|nr:methyl-accepting chemotaxis protein [Ideonella sp.]HJV68271.1 methyl-accepting chemotaxis protein [Ideonella sp.]